LFSKVIASFAPMSLIFGWASSEIGFVGTASQQGMYVHASDWAQNLATLTNFELGTFQQIGGAPGTLPVKEGTHTVTFVMTDGDNVQWLLNDFTTNTGIENCYLCIYLLLFFFLYTHDFLLKIGGQVLTEEKFHWVGQ